MKTVALALFAVLALPPNVARADCSCECVNGQVKALCTSSLDIEPICRPRICPIQTPSIEPIQTPRIPPLGTSECHQAQVYDGNSGQYVWRIVCQ